MPSKPTQAVVQFGKRIDISNVPCLEMYACKDFIENVSSEEKLQVDKKYTVFRNQSFGPKFGIFHNDYFLKASINDNNNFLVRILLLGHLSSSHKSILTR